MDGLSKFEAVYIALVFIVPGYIFLTCRNQFLPGQGRLGKDQIISYVTLSGVNFVLLGWIVYALYANDAALEWKIFGWVAVMALIPAGAGIALGCCTQREIIRRVYHWVGLEPIHRVPSAWDYKFSQSPGEWVLVTLKNGVQFAGWWAGRSFASDDKAERDLLIERVFEVPDNGPWRETSRSVLIAHGEIQTVEFIPMEPENVEVAEVA
jgi:hypothetical protein